MNKIYFKILFLILCIQLTPSLSAMEEYLKKYFPLPHERAVAIKPELLSISLSEAGETLSSRPARKRTSTVLKYYADFLCTEVNEEQENTLQENPLKKPRSNHQKRIVLKKEVDRRIKAFVCHYDGCTKSYDTEYLLNRHFVSHDDNRPFKCDQCGNDHKGFKQKHHLVEHIRRHSDPQIKCPECSTLFYRNSEMNRHFGEKH